MRFFWRKAPIMAFAAAVLAVTAPASATTGTAFSSTFQNTSSVTTSFRQADGNTFISQTVQVVYAGDLSGPVVEYIDIVVHPDGSLNAKGEDVCACTLAGTGRSGTIGLAFSATGDATGFVSGRFVFTGGTGGLAGMHGVGTFEANGSSGPFSGSYHFEP